MVRYLFGFVLLLWGCQEKTPELQKHTGYALGTSYAIQYATDKDIYETVQHGLDSIFYGVNRSMSTYLPASDITKINRDNDSLLVVDEHFVRVFKTASDVWSKTDGYFDPTVGAWVNAYGFGPTKPLTSISDSLFKQLQNSTGWDKIRLTSKNTIQKAVPETYLDFNALAKGYTVDLVHHYLAQMELKNHLVEIGGELVAAGINPISNRPWTIAIDDPLQTQSRKIIHVLSLKDEAIATSGNYRKFRVDSLTGEKYVHSINPKTGKPVKSKVLSASVKAPDCMTADAYATALMVMPFEKSKVLIEADARLEAYWILAEGDALREAYSSGWEN